MSGLSGKQPVYLPSKFSLDSQGISTDVCDLTVEHLGMSSSCLADRDGGKWCQKRVNKSSDSPTEWRRCNEKCPISPDNGEHLFLNEAVHNVAILIPDTQKLCLTEDNLACQFPYWYKSHEKTECLAPTWYQGPRCPTQLDEDLVPVPGSWGECKNNCVVGVRITKW